MKNWKILFLMLVFLLAGEAKAQNGQNEEPATPVTLTCGYFVPNSTNRPRIPEANAIIYLQGHTLFLNGQFSGYMMEVIVGEIVVYQTMIIGESQLTLPEDLQDRIYTICLTNEERFYIGNITL